MGYLEKVFLSTLLLFALVIIFLFGLYFDLGSMLQGTVQRTGDASTQGSFDRGAAQLERASMAKEVTIKDRLSVPFAGPRPVATPGISAGDANFAALFARYNQGKLPPPLDELQDRRRKELASKGFTQEYIEMEVRAMEDKPVMDSCMQIDKLMEEGKVEEAEQMLLEAIAGVDPRDLMTLQRYRMKLQQVYFDSNQLDKYKTLMKQVFETEEKILTLQASSPLMEDKRIAEGIRKEQEGLEQKKAEFDPWFDGVSKMAQETGSPHKMTDSMRAQVKAGLLREQEAGRISQKDLQDSLAQLEAMETRASKLSR
ncbi:MAG: hypothetical protein HY814_11745 [Candidatus Riflebacteria bacterium]|nr:hypothetical protein [Candidatus Riflebacteria bacterium]